MSAPTPARRKSPLQSLGRHVRDLFIRHFPIELRTERGLVVRLRNRSEISVYWHIFVERGYPFEQCAGELSGIDAPVVLDVGANSGLFGAAVFDRWRQAQLHSFEPQPQLIPVIRELAEINGLTARSHVNWCAVSDRNGEAELFQNRNPISASLIREKAGRRSIRRTCRVPVLTLDAYTRARGLERVDLLKVDVEGAELEVLRGAKGVLATTKLLFLEVHPPFSTLGAVADLLKESGLAHLLSSRLFANDQSNWAFVHRA